MQRYPCGQTAIGLERCSLGCHVAEATLIVVEGPYGIEPHAVQFCAIVERTPNLIAQQNVLPNELELSLP